MRRRAVVTGASRGIGRELVRRFADLDYEVFAVARSRDALDELAGAHGGSVVAAPCDVTDESAVIDLFAGLGPVDVLVNNAGVSHSAPLARTSLADWERQMAVNATAAFVCTRAVIDDMRQRGEGRIIAVASVAGRAGAAYASAYTASKHAVIGLMRAAAAELRGTRVTANAVCPTFVDTPMTDESAQRIAERTSRSLEDARSGLIELSPLGRLLRPQEVAEAVLYLASPAAEAINGQTIVLDGGGVQA